MINQVLRHTTRSRTGARFERRKNPCHVPTSRMELSSVFNRIHYLHAFRNAKQEHRLKMLKDITVRQLACIGEVARRIYHQTYHLLAQDVTYFDAMLFILGSGIFPEKESRLDPLSQDDLMPITTLLPLCHEPGSNPLSTRILNVMTCR